MTEPHATLLEDAALIITTDQDGNTFVRHQHSAPLSPPVMATFGPEVTALDRVDWKLLDSCLTGFTIGIVCVATFYVGKLMVEAVAWAVSQ